MLMYSNPNIFQHFHEVGEHWVYDRPLVKRLGRSPAITPPPTWELENLKTVIETDCDNMENNNENNKSNGLQSSQNLCKFDELSA